MLRTPAQFSIRKQFYTVKTFVFLFFQLMRKEKQPSQEETLKENQDLFIAGPLMGRDLLATGTGSSLQMLFCLLCHPKAALILRLKPFA